MNITAKNRSRKLPWRRIIPLGLFLLVMGYSYSRPTLERWFNVSLPAINQRGNGRFNSGSNNGGNYDAKLPSASSNSGGFSLDGDFELKEVGRDRYETPAGLLYTMGPRDEHRIEHVMRHAADKPGRHAHGVFLGGGDQDTVLKIIDDAYELVKSKSPRAEYEASDGKSKYDVDMQKKIGFEGGKKGQKSNNQSLNKVRMILDGNRVITAFPVR